MFVAKMNLGLKNLQHVFLGIVRFCSKYWLEVRTTTYVGESFWEEFANAKGENA